MKIKRVFGQVLVVLGISILFLKPLTNITGFSIASESISIIGDIWFILVAMGMILAGGILINGDRSSNTGLDELVSGLYTKINSYSEKHKANPKYLSGLKEIRKTINSDKENYSSSNNEEDKKIILERLARWNEGLDRRESYFFSSPHHVPGVIDLPDRGLYDYRPLGGKKTKYVELEVTHYTNQKSYESIKDALKKGKNNIMSQDAAGWAYFVSKPLKEGLTTKTLRRILGTGLQYYVGKDRVRNPESQMTFKIRVPKERILVKSTDYALGNKDSIPVKKYAIAGGIKKEDIVPGSYAIGGRYAEKNLSSEHTKKESWRLAEAA